jgi:hypothetical protein
LLLVSDETDCTRNVAGHTLNHNHRKPQLTSAPALPRFALPSDDASDADGVDETIDPLDAAATTQRPVLSSASARRLVRRKPSADETEEVQVEDILLEVYAEEPPPPRQSPSVAIAAAIASVVPAPISSVVPPAPAESAAVDALLRASEPVPFAPYPLYPSQPSQGQGQGQGPNASVPYVSAYAWGSPPPRGDDHETPSVSPMMLAPVMAPPPARPVLPSGNRPNRGLALAIWAVVIMVVGVAGGAAVVMGFGSGLYDRLASAASRAKTSSESKRETAGEGAAPTAVAAPATPSVAAPSVAAPSVAAPTAVAAPSVAAPTAVAAPAAMPTVSVDSLPKPAVAADSSLVTFPAYARGHRVFVDGRVIAVAEDGPTKIKCGRHMIKIGSGRKARRTDLACGAEVTLP